CPTRWESRVAWNLLLSVSGCKPVARGPTIALAANPLDDPVDFPERHPVHGLGRHPFRHGPIVSIESGVGVQVQGWVEQLAIDVPERQPLSAALSDDAKDRFGVSHLAYLPSRDIE